MINRHAAREIAFKYLYSRSIHQTVKSLPDEESLPSELAEFCQLLLDTYQQHAEEIDQWIEKYSLHWKVSRMHSVDLALLRLAVTEYQYCRPEDMNKAMVIDEALELAKVYSDEKSIAFINGVLNQALQEE